MGTVEFEFQESPGVNRTAKTQGTNLVSGGSHRANNPWWFVKKPGGVWDGPYEWLTYLGTDGNLWKTRLRGSTVPISNEIILSFESQKLDGGGHNETMEIVSWKGKKFHLTIDSVVGDNSGKHKDVKFNLTPLFIPH
jgi:hypothetical protein